MTSVVILSTGERGVLLSQYLLQLGYEIRNFIFDSEARAHGYAERMKSLDLPSDFCADMNSEEGLEKTYGGSPDVVIVAGFPQILRNRFIEMAPNGVLNLHPGRLPQYRGGSPLNWQLINGELEIGLSVILVDEGIDTGPVIASTTVPIEPGDDIKSMHEKANRLFPELTHQAVEYLLAGTPFAPQDETEARYWHQRSDADGQIRWHDMAPEEVRNFVRALTRPYPGAFAMCRGTKIRIFSISEVSLALRGTPGRVGYLSGKGPWVQCRDGAVLLDEYEVEGGGVFRLSSGDHFES